MPHRRVVLLLPALILPAATSAQTEFRVTASFSILADLVRQVGGARVRVVSVAGPDADVHAFSPRPSDIESITRARLLVRNGLGFDPWFDRLVRAAGTTAPVVTASERIVPLMAEPHHHHAGDHHGHGHQEGGRRRHHSVEPARAADPHAWQDVRNARVYVENIMSGLVAADPTASEDYRRNWAAYDARLASLDADIRSSIARIPQARRVVVTAHRAFEYFGAAYGVRFLAPQGVVGHAEPSAAEVANLIRFIRAERVSAVFLENVRNPALLQRIAAESGARIGGRLYSDSLSGPDGPAPTYEAMMRHNLGLLVSGMMGEAG